MTVWYSTINLKSVPSGQGRTVEVGDLRIALFNDGGAIFAIDDVCPHQGASLGEGLFHQGTVICPRHSWVFDVRSGQCPRGSHDGVRTYPTRCEDGAVQVQIVAGEFEDPA